MLSLPLEYRGVLGKFPASRQYISCLFAALLHAQVPAIGIEPILFPLQGNVQPFIRHWHKGRRAIIMQGIYNPTTSFAPVSRCARHNYTLGQLHCLVGIIPFLLPCAECKIRTCKILVLSEACIPFHQFGNSLKCSII